MPDIAATTLLTLKILILIGLGVYTVFAAVIVRQEQLMASVLEETSEPILRLLTIIHLSASIALFILTVILI
ncbi:hypothetical protein M1555_04110 [Patescibacteria group bacterium]|nr:hypothetical protein [Patescibacteria group bacterium]